MKHPEHYLEELKKLILDYTTGFNIKVYLIGSRASGKAGKTSDVDIALLPLESLPEEFIANLRELVEESTIPYNVDIVDLSEMDDEFRTQALRGAQLWKG